MSALWTAAEIASACNARSAATWTATGISIDSRTVATGDLFIALKGPNFDGHGFVAKALESGAVGALVHQVPENIPPSLQNRLIVVKDTFIGLNDLARAARTRAAARIVAVTGSVGKTGTKDMLRTALSDQGATHATVGNLNNHWGVPLTLARLPREARFGVIEIGMNHAGEIAPLSKLARPNAALVTTIEPAHLEFFASVAEIAAEKASIAAGLEPEGTMILPADNAEIDTLRRVTAECGARRIVTFGSHDDANIRLVDAAIGAAGTQVVAEIDQARVRYDLGIAGRHVALNSLAAIAAAQAIGADMQRFLTSLARIAPTAGRGDRRTIAMPGGALTVIDESYNASPASIRALAETMASLPRTAPSRLILVLGDMLELGREAPALHAGLAARLSELKFDAVYTAGALMEHLHNGLPRAMRGGHAKDSATLLPLVTQSVRAGDVIAVKGSHSSNMKPIVDALLALGGAAPARASNGH